MPECRPQRGAFGTWILCSWVEIGAFTGGAATGCGGLFGQSGKNLISTRYHTTRGRGHVRDRNASLSSVVGKHPHEIGDASRCTSKLRRSGIRGGEPGGTSGTDSHWSVTRRERESWARATWVHIALAQQRERVGLHRSPAGSIAALALGARRALAFVICSLCFHIQLDDARRHARYDTAVGKFLGAAPRSRDAA